MSVIEKLAKPSHLINMDDIIREGNPTLRAVAEEVTFPLSDEEIILGEKMLQFLKNSQDPVTFQNASLLFSFQILRTKTVIHQKMLIAYKKSCTIQKLWHILFKMLRLLMVRDACLLTVLSKAMWFVTRV